MRRPTPVSLAHYNTRALDWAFAFARWCVCLTPCPSSVSQTSDSAPVHGAGAVLALQSMLVGELVSLLAFQNQEQSQQPQVSVTSENPGE